MVPRVPTNSMRRSASHTFDGSVVPAFSKARASTSTLSYPSKATNVGSRPHCFLKYTDMCFPLAVGRGGRVYERKGAYSLLVPGSSRPNRHITLTRSSAMEHVGRVRPG